MASIERYLFLPSSLLVRLMPGEITNNYRALQTLYHKGLVNRCALPTLLGMLPIIRRRSFLDISRRCVVQPFGT